jgi:thiamine transport system ATP-binding protein
MVVSDRVAVLSAGRVEQAGEPQALYRRPATRFVAEFLGENNLFGAQVADSRRNSSPAPDETEGLPVRVEGDDFRLSRVEAPSDGRLTFCVPPAAFEVAAGANRLTVGFDPDDARVLPA